MKQLIENGVTERLIKPGGSARGALAGMLEIRTHKELFLLLVWRNLSSRYRQMALGVAWALLEPLMQVLLISLFFGFLFRLPSDGIKYPMFVLSGLLPWMLFNRVANSSAGSLRENIGLVGKVYFPRIFLPISSISKDLVEVGLLLFIVISAVIISGVEITANIFFLPLFLALDIVFGLAVGIAFSAPMVRFRDLQYVLQVGMQFLMYMTPVVYSATLVPEGLRFLYELNPLYWIIEGVRWSLLGKPLEATQQAAWAFGLAGVALMFSVLLFSWLSRRVADYH
jgi:lipopolysaccharide transport system permease protein